MGYIRHDAVIAVTSDMSKYGGQDATKAVEEFRKTIPEEFRKYLLGPVSGINADDMWCFTPDGSKEGWEHSDKVEEWRNKFIALVGTIYPAEFVAVSFGGDGDEATITKES